MHPIPNIFSFFSIAFPIFIIEAGNQLYFNQYPCGHLSQPFFFGKKSQQCYKPWRGCGVKDPDAQGGGSEKGIYLGSRQKWESNTGRGQKHGRSSRGEIQTESASTQIKVEAGKSEKRLTCKRPKLTNIDWIQQGGGVTENLHNNEQKTQKEKHIRLTEICRTPGNRTQELYLTNRNLRSGNRYITKQKQESWVT